MEVETEIYKCRRCNEEWEYIPEDYEEGQFDFICPHCHIPITQLLKDCWEEGTPIVERELSEVKNG